MKYARAWVIDTTERVAATFGEAFVAAFGLQGFIALAGGDWHTAATFAHSAEVAGFAAVVASLKSILAGAKTGTLSPASLVRPNRRRRTA